MLDEYFKCSVWGCSINYFKYGAIIHEFYLLTKHVLCARLANLVIENSWGSTELVADMLSMDYHNAHPGGGLGK